MYKVGKVESGNCGLHYTLRGEYHTFNESGSVDATRVVSLFRQLFPPGRHFVRVRTHHRASWDCYSTHVAEQLDS